jgi:hypothetical protein
MIQPPAAIRTELLYNQIGTSIDTRPPTLGTMSTPILLMATLAAGATTTTAAAVAAADSRQKLAGVAAAQDGQLPQHLATTAGAPVPELLVN